MEAMEALFHEAARCHQALRDLGPRDKGLAETGEALRLVELKIQGHIARPLVYVLENEEDGEPEEESPPESPRRANGAAPQLSAAVEIVGQDVRTVFQAQAYVRALKQVEIENVVYVQRDRVVVLAAPNEDTMAAIMTTKRGLEEWINGRKDADGQRSDPHRGEKLSSLLFLRTMMFGEGIFKNLRNHTLSGRMEMQAEALSSAFGARNFMHLVENVHDEQSRMRGKTASVMVQTACGFYKLLQYAVWDLATQNVGIPFVEDHERIVEFFFRAVAKDRTRIQDLERQQKNHESVLAELESKRKECEAGFAELEESVESDLQAIAEDCNRAFEEQALNCDRLHAAEAVERDRLLAAQTKERNRLQAHMVQSLENEAVERDRLLAAEAVERDRLFAAEAKERDRLQARLELQATQRFETERGRTSQRLELEAAERRRMKEDFQAALQKQALTHAKELQAVKDVVLSMSPTPNRRRPGPAGPLGSPAKSPKGGKGKGVKRS